MNLGSLASMVLWLQKKYFATVLWNMADTEESVEAPKPTKTPAQLEAVKEARAKKAENDEARMQERERLRAEARFEKLLDLFEKVRIEPPPPDVQKPPRVAVKAKPETKEVFLRFM